MIKQSILVAGVVALAGCCCPFEGLSITGDSGLYLRGVPQVQIWDAHNQWNIGSGGLYNNKYAIFIKDL